jgi:hypothetical protein
MLSYFKISLFVFLALIHVAEVRCIAIEINAEFEEKLERRITEVTDGLKNQIKDYSKLSQLVGYMDKHIGDDPSFYVTRAWGLLIRCEPHLDEPVWHLWDNVYRKAILMNVESNPYRLGQQIDMLIVRLRVAKKYHDEFSVIRDRKFMCDRMLFCWLKMLLYIDDLWDETRFDANEMVIVPLDEIKGGWASSGPYFFPHPNSITIENKEVREEYRRQVDAAYAKIKQAELQGVAKRVRREKKDGQVVKGFLIAMYSFQPFATSELEVLLKEHKLDEPFAKEVLDAVRKAEREAPPMTEYRDWETADGFFKAKAKFVSSDGKGVTLEKEDGKRTTVPLADLRWSDKIVVSGLTPKSEKPKTDSVP